jgi:hypothetical protein
MAALLALAGCAVPPPVAAPARPDPGFQQVIAMAAAQVKRCYRTPLGMRHAGRAIAVTLGVRYAPDGTLAAPPALVAERGVTPDNAVYARPLAEAAAAAVVQCSPLRLPPEYYRGGWEAFELTFAFGAVA